MVASEGLGFLDGAWWAVWWLAAVVWLAGMVGIVVAVVMAWRYHRAYRQRAADRGVLATLRSSRTLFIDDTEVTRLNEHLSRKRGEKRMDKVVQKVEERIVRERAAEGKLGSDGAGGGVSVKKTSEKATEAVVEAPEPNKILAFIIEELDGDGGVVHVDFTKSPAGGTVGMAGVVASNRALHALGVVAPDADELYLSHVTQTYVLLKARFQRTSGGSPVTFEAPFVPPQSAVIRVECAGEVEAKVRGSFLGVCLGRVDGWEDDGQIGVLHLDPVAVFG